jgi:hypothetical protein
MDSISGYKEINVLWFPRFFEVSSFISLLLSSVICLRWLMILRMYSFWLDLVWCPVMEFIWFTKRELQYMPQEFITAIITSHTS